MSRRYQYAAVRPHMRPPMTDDESQKAVELYVVHKLPMKSIAERFGRQTSTIAAVLDAANIKREHNRMIFVEGVGV